MLQTKLYMPRISRKAISRKAVGDKLALLSDYKIALVTAPAGYGKTTAVVDFLEKSDKEYAWLSIDEADNDPVRFWNYIKASIGGCLKDGELLSGISVNTELISSNMTMDLLINALNGIIKDIILVIDDYHLIHNAVIQKSVEYFINYMPHRLNLIILSRREDDNFYKLRSKEEALNIGLKELSFSLDETNEFFKQRGMSLNKNDIAELVKSTEGWAAGLVAASISFMENDDISKSVNAFSGKNHTIDEILKREIFSQWTDEIKSFLVQTAFLSRLSGPLCAKVTGNKRSGELLKLLSETNSFIIPLDQDKTWFRYHYLFQDFLLQRLSSEDLSIQRHLFSLAGKWYEGNGYTQDSIDCYIKAEQYEKAFPLVWDIYLEVAQNGEYALWRKWIESMPEELCESDVRACTGYSWILSIQNQVDKAELWAHKAKACFKRIKSGLDKMEQDYLVANIMLAYVNVAVFKLDADSAIRYYKNVQELNVCTSVIVGEMNSGEPSLLETPYGFKGRLNKVSQVYENYVEDVPRVLGDFSAYISVVFAECQYERNDLKGAYTMLLKSMGRITGLHNSGIIVPCCLTLAKIKRAKGDMDGVLQIIASGRTSLGESKSVWNYFLDVLMADFYLSNGDIYSAKDWLAMDHMEIFETISVSREFESMVYAKYLILSNHLDEAYIILSRLEDFAKIWADLGAKFRHFV